LNGMIRVSGGMLVTQPKAWTVKPHRQANPSVMRIGDHLRSVELNALKRCTGLIRF